MAVYTKLSIDEIKNITKKYFLGNLKKFQGIKEGIENTNYLLITSNGKYILTIFEKIIIMSKTTIITVEGNNVKNW